MPTTITTEVYTLAELVERGDERAVERALDWMGDAFESDAHMNVIDALKDALGVLPGMRVTEWDAYRHTLTLEGSLRFDAVRDAEEGHPLHGLTLTPARPGWVGIDYHTDTARDYGGDLWLFLTDEAGFGWWDDTYSDALDEVEEWLRKIEARLSILMREEYDYCTSREYLLECAEANGYTFTADGKRFG